MRPCEMYKKITNARDDITEALRGVGQNGWVKMRKI